MTSGPLPVALVYAELRENKPDDCASRTDAAIIGAVGRSTPTWLAQSGASLCPGFRANEAWLYGTGR